MKNNRCALFPVVIAILACFFFGGSVAYAKVLPVGPDGIRVAFGPVAEKEFGLDDMFIEFLDGAKKTVDMAFYEIRLDNIVDAIIKTHKRGVNVRVIVDNDNYCAKPVEGDDNDDVEATAIVSAGEKNISSHTPENSGKVALNPFVERLLKAGVPVIEDSGRSALMHNKFAVRDGNMVWTGSYNLTDTCSYVNVNNAITIPSKELADVYAAEFKEMFVDKKFGNERPKGPPAPLIKVSDVGIEALFAPEDNPNGRIAQLIAAARTEIIFMQFAFTDDTLGNLLVQKKHQGVAVHGIFDRILYHSTGPFGEFSKLTDADIPVRIYSGDGKLHDKLFVIDPAGPDPIVVLGSENASSNGNSSNDENILIVHSKRIAALYKAEFQRYEGTYSQVSAQIGAGEFPFAGTTIDQVDLMIFGNGVPVDRLTIEFPARWSLASQTRDDIHILRKGVDVTSQSKLTLTDRAITLDGANLSGTGANSWLLVRCNNVQLPEISGKYAVLVSTQAKSGQSVPLARQPVICVLDPKNEAAFSDLLGFLNNLNVNLDKFGPGFSAEEKNDWKKRLASLNDKTNQLVCDAVKKKDDKRVALALDFLESLSGESLKAAAGITDNFRNLRQAFQFRLAHASNDAEAKAEFKRLEDVIAKIR
ncbi:MAG: hypothetical protein HQM09_19580 [Candidatus Riflebacteria bacterium]|nr:hypothetical protein [Candidatus Riflebacteria bacterium]